MHKRKILEESEWLGCHQTFLILLKNLMPIDVIASPAYAYKSSEIEKDWEQ